ncbi:MAG: hypothetical protein IPF49_05895 [Gammaproteobacteria bacterium]|nr:hypothetical protein [Gammaproteobacteria bacterium]
MNKCKFRYYVWILLTVINSGCGQTGGNPETQDLEIAGKYFRIPSQYVMPELPDSLAPSNKQMDKDEGVILEIPLNALGLKATLGDVSTFDTHVHVFISQPSSYENKFRLNPTALNAWTGTGLYRDRIVDRDQGGLFRVYPKAGIQSFGATSKFTSGGLQVCADVDRGLFRATFHQRVSRYE